MFRVMGEKMSYSSRCWCRPPSVLWLIVRLQCQRKCPGKPSYIAWEWLVKCNSINSPTQSVYMTETGSLRVLFLINAAWIYQICNRAFQCPAWVFVELCGPDVSLEMGPIKYRSIDLSDLGLWKCNLIHSRAQGGQSSYKYFVWPKTIPAGVCIKYWINPLNWINP